jgi:hypothetical protein
MIDTVEPEKVIDTSPAKKHRENYENRTKHAGLALDLYFYHQILLRGPIFLRFPCKVITNKVANYGAKGGVFGMGVARVIRHVRHDRLTHVTILILNSF